MFEATERVGKIAEGFILAIPVSGIALILMSHRVWSFSQAWVAAALAIYAAAITLSFGFHLPNLRRMGALMHELVLLSDRVAVAVGGPVETGSVGTLAPAGGSPSQATELQRRPRLAGLYGATLNLAMVVAVILMSGSRGASP